MDIDIQTQVLMTTSQINLMVGKVQKLKDLLDSNPELQIGSLGESADIFLKETLISLNDIMNGVGDYVNSIDQVEEDLVIACNPMFDFLNKSVGKLLEE